MRFFIASHSAGKIKTKARIRNNHYFWDIIVGYGYGYRIFMVGYGYIIIITKITILINNRITILKMVMYMQKNDQFLTKQMIKVKSVDQTNQFWF